MGSLAVVVMVLALNAWAGPAELAVQVSLNRLQHRPRCAGDRFDAVLFKKSNRPVAHPTGQYHLGSLPVNKFWDLARSVMTGVRVVNGFDRLNPVVLDFGDGKVGAAAKVLTDQAAQALVVEG
jgi:hypothetical protein